MSNYRDYPIPLAAGVRQELTVLGDYWQIITSAGDVWLEFDQGTRIKRRQGMGGPAKYTSVGLLSDTDQSIIISLGLSNGAAPYDNRSGSGGGGGGGGDSGLHGTSLRNPDDANVGSGATSRVITSDPTRVELILSVPEDAGGPLRMGNSTVSATRGSLIYAGDRIALTNSAEVWVYNGSAAAVVFGLLESLA